MMGRGSAGILLVLLAAAVGCAQPVRRGEGLNVVATVSPITNLVENIAGDRVNLTGLVPEGVNSHTSEPSPSDAKVVAEADLIFMNGLRLEEPTKELAKANLKDGAKIVELGSRTIDRSEWIFDFSFPESEGDPNPHVWTNPPYAKRFTEVIEQELEEADGSGSTTFRTNRSRLDEKLDALVAATRLATDSVPMQRRKLLTYHDSFPYFAREFGWQVVGAIQPSDFSEPNAREVAALIDQIRAEGVTAIFGSEVFPSPVLEQIARETGTRYIDDLRDDDLPGDPGDTEHSYLGLMRFDFVTIVEALGGDAAALKTLDVANLAKGDADYR